MTAEDYNPIPDLALLLDAALRAGWNALPYVDRLTERLSLEPSGGPEAAEKLLRKALAATGACETVTAAHGTVRGQTAPGGGRPMTPEPFSPFSPFTPPPGCDAHLFGGHPSVLDGRCRCMTCGRCGHHSASTHQGHHGPWCSVTGGMREPHFCCPDTAHGCELEALAPAAAEVAVPDVIVGTVTPEDMMRASLRAAGINVPTAAETRAAVAEAGRAVGEFIRASRAEDGRCPDCGSGIPGEPVDCPGGWHAGGAARTGEGDGD